MKEVKIFANITMSLSFFFIVGCSVTYKDIERYKNSGDVIKIVRALNDPDLIESTTRALVELKDPRAVKPLINLLKHPYRTVTKEVLLYDIESNNSDDMQRALLAFIWLGNKDIIPLLIRKLDSHGTKTIAEAYLNCGNEDLSSAASAWAIRHNYEIRTGSGYSPVKWGGTR